MKEQYSDFLKLLFSLTKEKKNFKLSGNDIESYIQSLSKDDFIEIVKEIGTIPEVIEASSTEEKLYSKASDIVLNLPSAPKQFIRYMEEDNRPQTQLDRDYENGMGISMGRLREDNIFDYKFVGLSHNTLRGAAGGGVLSAEYLTAAGYITAK